MMYMFAQYVEKYLYLHDDPQKYIAYYESGNPNSEYVILLLHGFLSNKKKMMQKILPITAKYAQTFAIDFIGHGNSFHLQNEEYSSEILEYEFKNIIESFAKNKKIIIIAHSLSAWFSLKLLQTSNANIQAIAILDIGPWMPEIVTCAAQHATCMKHIIQLIQSNEELQLLIFTVAKYAEQIQNELKFDTFNEFIANILPDPNILNEESVDTVLTDIGNSQYWHNIPCPCLWIQFSRSPFINNDMKKYVKYHNQKNLSEFFFAKFDLPHSSTIINEEMLQCVGMIEKFLRHIIQYENNVQSQE